MRHLWQRFRGARRTLRFRTTAAAALVVWIVLTIGAGAVVGFQQQLLEADVDLLLAEDLDTVSAALFAGASPDEAVDEADPTAGITIDDGNTQIGREPRIDRRGRHGSQQDPGDIRRLVRTIQLDGRDLVLTATRDTGTVEDATGRSVRGAFAIVPIVTAFVAGVVWISVGRALRPVEAMRADAAAIVGSRDSQRLGSPGTGDEIERLTHTLNSMLDRLSAADERQRQLLADAAHELRSPLAGLRTRIETGDLEPTAALGEIRRLQDLVDSLLLLSRSDAGELRRADILVDLDDVIDEAVLSLGPTPVIIDTSGVAPHQVRGDHDLLVRVVLNLVDNAVRHATSTVWIAVTDDGHPTVTVSDDGPGIAPADRHRAFERFVRLDDARDRGSGGSGLGLAISRELAELHGGTLDVADDGPGATLVLRLPPSRSVDDGG